MPAPRNQRSYESRTRRSRRVFEDASRYFPGGVNSAIQYFSPYPLYVTRGEGSRVWDIDGNEYIDYCLAYGAATAGHRNPEIMRAIKSVADNVGTLLGFPTPSAIGLAKEIVRRFPGVEMLRFTNSGTEATMYAVRLARAVTGRNKIVKVEGAYHGAHDYLLISDKPTRRVLMGSERAPASVPDSAGTPEEVAALTLVVRFNDMDGLERVLRENENEVAAVVMEAVQTNSGLIPPAEGYLKEVRRLTEYYGVLLIIDEVKTGFNAAAGPAYAAYGIVPDLVTMGKVVGGGTPLAAFGGRAEYMEEVTPLGRAVHYGTYNANPLSVAAGYAALTKVHTEKSFRQRAYLSERLAKGLRDIVEDAGITAYIMSYGAMGAIYFGLEEQPRDFREAFRADKAAWHDWWLGMLVRGVIPYAGAWFEEWFVSVAHTEEDVDKYLVAAEEVLKGLARG